MSTLFAYAILSETLVNEILDILYLIFYFKQAGIRMEQEFPMFNVQLNTTNESK